MRFPEQALAEAFALALFGEFAEPDALDGDHAADGRVLGFVNHAHGAAAQFSDDSVAPDIFHGFAYFTAAPAASPRIVQWAIIMTISDALLPEFDHEISTTRKLLERVPEDKWDWTPHEKSMKLGRLACHVAETTQFAIVCSAFLMRQPSLKLEPLQR